jgi:hypothetical protein
VEGPEDVLAGWVAATMEQANRRAVIRKCGPIRLSVTAVPKVPFWKVSDFKWIWRVHWRKALI